MAFRSVILLFVFFINLLSYSYSQLQQSNQTTQQIDTSVIDRLKALSSAPLNNDINFIPNDVDIDMNVEDVNTQKELQEKDNGVLSADMLVRNHFIKNKLDQIEHQQQWLFEATEAISKLNTQIAHTRILLNKHFKEARDIRNKQLAFIRDQKVEHLDDLLKAADNHLSIVKKQLAHAITQPKISQRIRNLEKKLSDLRSHHQKISSITGL